MLVLARNSGAVVPAGEDASIALRWYNAAALGVPPGITSLRRFEIPPLAELGMHEHDGPDHEVLVPLVGRFRVYCADGEEAVIAVGDLVISTPGQSHAVANMTGFPAELLIFATAPHQSGTTGS
jgi:quercetin dioxygenase-like cupin family protein